MVLEILDFYIIESDTNCIIRINNDIKIEVPTPEDALYYVSTIKESILDGLPKK